MSACQFAAAIGAEEDVAARLLTVVSEVIEKYAPDAPGSISNEAAIRYGGYLKSTQSTLGLRSVDLGQLKVEPMATHGAAFHSSGAAGLLSRFRTHRGGVVG